MEVKMAMLLVMLVLGCIGALFAVINEIEIQSIANSGGNLTEIKSISDLKYCGAINTVVTRDCNYYFTISNLHISRRSTNTYLTIWTSKWFGLRITCYITLTRDNVVRYKECMEVVAFQLSRQKLAISTEVLSLGLRPILDLVHRLECNHY